MNTKTTDLEREFRTPMGVVRCGQIILTIIFLLIFNQAYGQDELDPTDIIISDFKVKMEKENVSEYFILKKLQHGHLPPPPNNYPQNCKIDSSFFTMYGFWFDGTEAWVKKYDSCGEVNSVRLSDTAVLEYYKNNFKEIKSREVERFKPRSDSVANGEAFTYISMASHTPLRFYWFFQGSTQFEKSFDKYDLTTEDDHFNLNYESNNNLAIVKLNSICEAIIDSMYTEKKFIR